MYEYVILQVAIHQTLHVVHEYVLKILTCLKFRPNLSSSFRSFKFWPKVQVRFKISSFKKKNNKTTKHKTAGGLRLETDRCTVASTIKLNKFIQRHF